MNKEKYDGKTDGIIALAGNPNVGKSTIFNALTGMNQHTGNWAGKTVECSGGKFRECDKEYGIVDIPGTFSIYPRSKEEEVAADFLAFGKCDCCVVVVDAARPERSLKLALELADIMPKVLLCFNLLDEAKKLGVGCDFMQIGETLGLETVGVIAKKKKTLSCLKDKIACLALAEGKNNVSANYPTDIESAIERIGEELAKRSGATERRSIRYAATAILLGSPLCESGERLFGRVVNGEEAFIALLSNIRQELFTKYGSQDGLSEAITQSLIDTADTLCARFVKRKSTRPTLSAFDRVLTGKLFAFPLMFLLLLTILFITVTIANYPSALLELLFSYLGKKFNSLLIGIGTPELLRGALYDGIYTVLTRVISVMLPPMAIFFPLFTLLEDTGFLPRFAYNLDRPLCAAGACGKQALSMCMCLGCTASGIIGCRIIDSPRERKIALVTSSFMPCNGKFPTMILIAATFFPLGQGFLGNVGTALFLSTIILFGVGMTLLCSKILSKTVYKGSPSFFTIEMPPFRKPDVVKILIRSLIDRTLSVLGRAVVVAAPAGLVIWLLVTVKAGDVSLLSYISGFLDPFALLLGLDGVILTAFILGFPANEIVLPIAVMGYTASGIGEAFVSGSVGEVLIGAGWGIPSAICCALFSLFHFPCSTSVLTAYKETKSIKTTLLCFLLPTAVGVTVCMIANLLFLILGIK